MIQGPQITFAEIPTEEQKLIDTLIPKTKNPMQPTRHYFSKISYFLKIESKSSEICYKNHSSMNKEFDTEMFVSQTADHFLEHPLMQLKLILISQNR